MSNNNLRNHGKSEKKIVVLVSGGIDSTLMLAQAKKEPNCQILALSFLYGQRHHRELESAKAITDYYKVKHRTVQLPTLEGSSLTSSGEQFEEKNDQKTLPSTFVPGRNILFLTLAAAQGFIISSKDEPLEIWIGATAADQDGYPDCRVNFLIKMEEALKEGLGMSSLSLKYPLVTLSKKEIIQEAYKLKVPLELTWTCYKGEEKPCGECDSCKFRAEGFKEAEIKDPLVE